MFGSFEPQATAERSSGQHLKLCGEVTCVWFRSFGPSAFILQSFACNHVHLLLLVGQVEGR